MFAHLFVKLNIKIFSLLTPEFWLSVFWKLEFAVLFGVVVFSLFASSYFFEAFSSNRCFTPTSITTRLSTRYYQSNTFCFPTFYKPVSTTYRFSWAQFCPYTYTVTQKPLLAMDLCRFYCLLLCFYNSMNIWSEVCVIISASRLTAFSIQIYNVDNPIVFAFFNVSFMYRK